MGVRPWEAESFVAVVPAHDVRRTSVLATYLEDLPLAAGRADGVTLHDEPIACLGLHRDHLFLLSVVPTIVLSDTIGKGRHSLSRNR